MDYCVSAIGVLFCTFFFFFLLLLLVIFARRYFCSCACGTHTHTYMNSTKHIYSRCGQNGKCLRDAAQKLLCQQQTQTHTSHYACLSPIFFSFFPFIHYFWSTKYIYIRKFPSCCQPRGKKDINFCSGHRAAIQQINICHFWTLAVFRLCMQKCERITQAESSYSNNNNNSSNRSTYICAFRQ